MAQPADDDVDAQAEEKYPPLLEKQPNDPAEIRMKARSNKLAKKVAIEIVAAFNRKDLQATLMQRLCTHINEDTVFQSLLWQTELRYNLPQVATTLFKQLYLEDQDDVVILLKPEGSQNILDALAQTIKKLALNQLVIPQPGSVNEGPINQAYETVCL